MLKAGRHSAPCHRWYHGQGPWVSFFTSGSRNRHGLMMPDVDWIGWMYECGLGFRRHLKDICHSLPLYSGLFSEEFVSNPCSHVRKDIWREYMTSIDYSWLHDKMIHPWVHEHRWKWMKFIKFTIQAKCSTFHSVTHGSVEAGAMYINKGGASGISDLAGEPDTWRSTFHVLSLHFLFIALCALDFPGHNQQNGEPLGGAPCSGMDLTNFQREG